MTLANLIIEYRNVHGLSQRQMGTRCGLSTGYISLIEKEINPQTGKPMVPTLTVLNKIAQGMDMTIDRLISLCDDMPVEMGREEGPAPSPVTNIIPIDPSRFHRIPILGYISAGLPLYAEEHIEGYTYTDLNGGAEYFALKVKGDSMNALGINDGYQIIVRRQDEVENGEVAVVLVGDEDATVKRFYATASTVTLMPQSTNPTHQPQLYDLKKTPIKVLGKVVKVEFSL